MQVDVRSVLEGPVRAAAWEFYRGVFDDLRLRAVEQHVLDRHHFDDLMADSRITKFVAVGDDEVVGLAAQTDDLRTLPWLSQDYFAHRWPELYAQRRIFYTVFVGAKSGRRGAGVFVSLLAKMLAAVQARDGMVMIDVCTHNEVELKLPEAIARVLHRIAGSVRASRIDAQSYWLYEFPDAS